MYSTRYLGRERDYIVIRHPLRDMDGMISGVKFRRGYAVVEKGSKYYSIIKKLPYLKSALEFPLEHLKKLPFILRDREVEVIYGKDVYVHYMKAITAFNKKQAEEKKKAEEEAHLSSKTLCQKTTRDGELCKHEAFEASPSQYCKIHLFDDPKIEELGFDLNKRRTRAEKKEFKDQVCKELIKLKANNAF